MPCNFDHLEPREKEKESRQVAKFLVFALPKMGKNIPPQVANAAHSMYGDEELADRFTRELCDLIKSMDDADLTGIVYNAHNKTSRDLADWWEAHLEKDKERERKEEAAKEIEALRKQALSKLSKPERQALGFE